MPAADRMWNDLSIVPQRLGLIEELTVAENIRLPLRLGQEDAAEDQAHRMMYDLGLAQFGRAPTEISLGEQQRTGLARALVSSPRLVLADEPTGNQDAVWERGVLRALRRAAEVGTTSLIATHNEEVLKYVTAFSPSRMVICTRKRWLRAAGGCVLTQSARPPR